MLKNTCPWCESELKSCKEKEILGKIVSIEALCPIDGSYILEETLIEDLDILTLEEKKKVHNYLKALRTVTDVTDSLSRLKISFL